MEEYRVLTFRDSHELENFLNTERVTELDGALHFQETHELPIFLYSGNLENVEKHQVLTFREIHDYAAFLQSQPVINCSFQSDAGNQVSFEWILRTLLGSRELKSFTADYSKSFGNVKSCEVLGELLQTSTTLETLSLNGVAMNGDGLEYIVKGLLKNSKSVLRRLEVRSTENLKAKGAELVAELFSRKIPTLTTVGIWCPGFTIEKTAPVARAVALNTTIEFLSIGAGHVITSPEREGAMSHILRALTPADRLTEDEANDQCGRHNSTIRHLSIHYGFEKDLVKNITRMLRGNTGLVKLGLRHAQFNCEEWKQVFASLRTNEHVEDLDLSGGTDLDQAFECLMELLQANCTIKQVQLGSTSLEADGRSSQVNAVLALNILKGSAKFVPPSNGRVFLCGYPGAGKTTLSRSMVPGPFSRRIREIWRSLKKKCWHDNQSNTCRRTQGIEVQVLHSSSDKHITIWDMTGEEDYHTLQSCHYLFPEINQSSIFLFVYRPFDDDGAKRLPDPKVASERLKTELRHWLNFVSSNSRKTGGVLPKISVVLTHLDKILDAKWFRSAEKYVAWANDTISGLKVAFRGRVEVHDSIHAVDAHHAENVIDHVLHCFDQLFRDLPKVPAACEQMNLVLSKWAVQHHSEPIVTPETFFDLCSKSVTELQVLFQRATGEDKRHQIRWAVKSYLHDVGSIINLEASKCIVVDPEWLGRVFVGELFNPGAFPPTENGVVPDHILENYLAEFISNKRYRGFSAQHLINLMEDLKLCYETTSRNTTPKHYFIPRALHDPWAQTHLGRRKLHWTPQQTNSLPSYRGFRLQIADQSQNFLCAGVFQRYQFLTRERIVCDVEQNLIRIKHDGMEMLVETSGEGGDYVDILIRSYSSETAGMEKLYTDVLQEFQSICKSRRECAGVTLQEAILRPACVENLTLCTYRKNQAVLRESLKDDLVRKLLNLPSEEQEIYVQDANANVISDDFLEKRNHKHPFAAVPEAELPEEWVKATDMLTIVDIKEAIFKYRQSVSQQTDAIYQAADELLSHTMRTTPEAASSSTTYTEITSQRGVSENQVSAVATEDGSTLQIQISYIKDMEQRFHDDIAVMSRSLENTMQTVGVSILDELKGVKQLLQQLLQKSMEDVQRLHQNLQKALVDKFDQVLCIADGLQGIPKIPYFTDSGVGLPQRFVSFIQFGKPLKLHFMCEEPSKVHYVKEQKGLPVINLSEKKVYQRLRPIVSVSLKLLFILVKAGLHVGAGIGNAISDFSTMDGAMPLMAVSLTGETFINELKKTSYNETAEDLKDAWQCVQELVGPLVRQGKIPENFQLYQVRYKANYLKQNLSPDRVYWVCGSCRRKAANASLLDDKFNSFDNNRTPRVILHREDIKYD